MLPLNNPCPSEAQSLPSQPLQPQPACNGGVNVQDRWQIFILDHHCRRRRSRLLLSVRSHNAQGLANAGDQLLQGTEGAGVWAGGMGRVECEAAASRPRLGRGCTAVGCSRQAPGVTVLSFVAPYRGKQLLVVDDWADVVAARDVLGCRQGGGWEGAGRESGKSSRSERDSAQQPWTAATQASHPTLTTSNACLPTPHTAHLCLMKLGPLVGWR